MINRIKEIYIQYREAISYLFFGVLTTAVDFITDIVLTRFFSVGEGLANVIAQIVAILFAFFTNKLFVFEDRSMKLQALAVQFFKFASLRLVTLILNSAMFFVMIDVLQINDIITKVIVSVIVIILNYIFSKLIVFKKKEGN